MNSYQYEFYEWRNILHDFIFCIEIALKCSESKFRRNFSKTIFIKQMKFCNVLESDMQTYKSGHFLSPKMRSETYVKKNPILFFRLLKFSSTSFWERIFGQNFFRDLFFIFLESSETYADLSLIEIGANYIICRKGYKSQKLKILLDENI